MSLFQGLTFWKLCPLIWLAFSRGQGKRGILRETNLAFVLTQLEIGHNMHMHMLLGSLVGSLFLDKRSNVERDKNFSQHFCSYEELPCEGMHKCGPPWERERGEERERTMVRPKVFWDPCEGASYVDSMMRWCSRLQGGLNWVVVNLLTMRDGRCVESHGHACGTAKQTVKDVSYFISCSTRNSVTDIPVCYCTVIMS